MRATASCRFIFFELFLLYNNKNNSKITVVAFFGWSLGGLHPSDHPKTSYAAAGSGSFLLRPPPRTAQMIRSMTR